MNLTYIQSYELYYWTKESLMLLKETDVIAIDDDSFSLMFIKDQLNEAGAKSIETYLNANDALEYIRSNIDDIGLLILDLQMPEFDGISVLKSLGEINFTGHILIYSGFEQKVLNLAEQIALEHQLNMLGSLPKPFTLSQLEDVISLATVPSDSDKEKTLSQVNDAKVFSLDEGELVLARQPLYDLQKNEIASYEILSRWRNDDGELLSPDYFITVLEESGEIDLFQERLFDLALKKISQDHTDIRYAVNLSMTCMGSQDVPALISQFACKYNVAMEKLIFEVTESGVSESLTQAKEVLIRLRIMGLTLALDDFGTGYSTLDKLCDLPFKEIKLDRRYVTNCDQEPEKQAIIRSMVKIAQSMGLVTVAEGIETEDELNMVRALGVDYGQGYLLSKPQLW